MKVLVNSCWAHFSEEKKEHWSKEMTKRRRYWKIKYLWLPRLLSNILNNVACQRGRCLLRENFCTLQLIIINTWIAKLQRTIYNHKPFIFFKVNNLPWFASWLDHMANRNVYIHARTVPAFFPFWNDILCSRFFFLSTARRW